MGKDLVCGMDVDEKTAAATAEYRGKMYFFCARSCKEKFVQDPEKYITHKKMWMNGMNMPVK